MSEIKPYRTDVDCYIDMTARGDSHEHRLNLRTGETETGRELPKCGYCDASIWKAGYRCMECKK